MRHAILAAALAIITTSFAPADDEALAASSETAELRSRLSDIVGLENDADFLRAWHDMRKDLGLQFTLIHGSVVPVGLGVHVLIPDERRPTWGFRYTNSERDNVHVAEERFVRVITEDGVSTDCGQSISEDAVVVIGLGDGRTAVVYQATGRVAFISSD